MRVFLTILSMSAFLFINACSNEEPPKEQAATQDLAIGLAISTQNNPFFVTLRQGAEDEAKALGLRLVTVDAQDDPMKQLAGVEDLIQKKVKVILINPTDSAAAVNAVKEAVHAGIPVISLDRTVMGNDVTSHIASDNVAGGVMATEFLIQQMGGSGNVVELQGIPGSSVARERGQGFNQVLMKFPKVKTVATQPADFDRAKGLAVMENILQGHPDIQGVFAQNDEMALGAIQALQAAGLKKVVVVGFDATQDGLAAVKAGTMAGTVQQKPEMIGKMGVITAKKLIDGKTVEKNIPVPLAMMTHDTVQ